MAVEQELWSALVQAYENEGLRGALVILAFKNPDGSQRLEFIKAFPDGTKVTEVLGLLEVLKHQSIGNEEIFEWRPNQ